MTAQALEKARAQSGLLGPCPIIETRRLVLRPHQIQDADAIAQSLGDWQVTRMLARVPVPYSRSDAIDWLNAIEPGGDWHLAITEGDGVHIGCISVERVRGQWHLGYWLNRFYWGQGMMSEAADAVADRFFRRKPEEALHSGAFADNAGSLRIQEKLGFRILRCSDLFSVSRNGMAPHLETQVTAEQFRRP